MTYGMGFMELLLLVVFGGSAPVDLVSLVDADDYFTARKIDLTVEKMMELAGAEPRDGTAQIQQLLALRVLGDDPAEVKQSPRHTAVVKLVRDIATGARSQDPLGFAKLYAQHTLARLEGKKPGSSAMPKDSLKAEAFRWFPAQATLMGATDFRGGGEDVDQYATLRKIWTTNIPPQAKGELYAMVEMLGNIRIERVAFAFHDAPNSDDEDEIYIRLTGKADRKRLSDVLQKKGSMTVTQRGDVALFTKARGPAIAIIGDGDLLLAGYQKTDSDHLKLLDGVLALRTKDDGSAATGKLGEQLQKAPAGISGVLLGEVPSGLRRELTRGPIPAAPQAIFATLKRDNGVSIQFEATLDNADDAKAFSAAMTSLRDQGLAALQNVPKQAPAPVQVLKNMQNTLASLRLTPNGRTAQGSLQVVGNAAEMMQSLMLVGHSETRIEQPKAVPVPQPK